MKDSQREPHNTRSCHRSESRPRSKIAGERRDWRAFHPYLRNTALMRGLYGLPHRSSSINEGGKPANNPQMSQKEYAEDTAFWSMKKAVQFSARRRTVSVFFSSSLKNKTGKCESYTWIDNTPEVWSNLNHVLSICHPSTIAINVDPEIAFGAGLHVGEYHQFEEHLDAKWKERFVNQPMVAVEFIATKTKSQIVWYKKLMDTAWAIITDGFSERVITPGKTTPEV